MLILRMTLECVTPLHCGGGEDEIQDQPVIRDAFGHWLIPGTSLAGSLRSLAAGLDENLADRLFGWQEGDAPHPSLVWCEDALFLDYDGAPCLAKILKGETPIFRQEDGPFIRDHARLGLDTGAAEKGAKFDAEIAPAGSRFLLEIRCDGWDRRLSSEEKDFFTALCGEVLAGGLTLGGKAGQGYGHYKTLEHSFAEIDLFEPDGVNAWLGLEPYNLPLPGKPMPVKAASAAPAKAGLDGWLEIPLECAGPILIGGGAPDRKDGRLAEADILFALTPRLNYGRKGVSWLAALPASSLRGVLRHAIHDILASLGCSAKGAESILNGIFGYVAGTEASQGRLEVEDAVLIFPQSGSPWQFEQHVAIDRFTGAALEGALFSEEPCWAKGVQTRMRLKARKLAAHEAALLFHALFDLFDGAIAVGSGANRGNGRLAPHGWATNPAQALNLLQGGISWNGKRIFENGNGAETLTALSGAWDQALKEKVANV